MMFSTDAKSKQKDGDTESKEVRFNYKKMNHYDLLGVASTASDKEMKLAYLNLAKKFHPDVYKGLNKDHFKKVNEAYSVLKNKQKRAAYDNLTKVRSRQQRGGSGEQGDAEEQEGHGPQSGSKSREYQDPEFEAAFQKLNTQLLFDQFMARPMQSRPEELSEEFMVADHIRKMSKRDIARARFI